MSSRLAAVMAKGPDEMTEEDYELLTEAQLADWQYAHKDELDAIEGEPVDFEVSPNLALIMSFRLSGEEAQAIRLAANAEGATLSEFIRAACADRIDAGKSAQPDVERRVARALDDVRDVLNQALDAMTESSAAEG